MHHERPDPLWPLSPHDTVLVSLALIAVAYWIVLKLL